MHPSPTTARLIAAAHTDAALGILPLGTSNDVARSLDIPLDLEQAVRLLAMGPASTVDLGSRGHRCVWARMTTWSQRWHWPSEGRTARHRAVTSGFSVMRLPGLDGADLRGIGLTH